jgi:alkyl hydroperoxide reductase subunit D
MDKLYDLFPDSARDLKLNLQNVLKQAELTPQQTWGTAVACAIAVRSPRVTEEVLAQAGQHLTAEALEGARAAAAIMGMNNIYYRFQHLSGNERYKEIPARLRMQAIRNHGVEAVDFELWCLAVSAINGCSACVVSHEGVLREKGVGEETILAAVRIASVLHGAGSVIDALPAA